MSKAPLPIWGWACIAGIVSVFALMIWLEREPNQYTIAALVMVAAFILGVSIPPPWGGGTTGKAGE